MSNATGLIIVDHGSRRTQSNLMLEEVARLYAARYAADTAIVEPAHMELAMPDIAAAYARCVERGARRIVVAPFFLAKGKHWTRDIPSLVNQASANHPGTAYQLAEPLGIDDLILDLLRKRATADDQPVIPAGGHDERSADDEPTQRRIQCTTCPFRVTAKGEIHIRPESGVTVAQLAGRAASVA